MKRRRAKRITPVRVRIFTPEGREIYRTDLYVVPHKWKRIRDYYDTHDTSQAFEHDPRLSLRMVAVLGRKPRAGRRRG